MSSDSHADLDRPAFDQAKEPGPGAGRPAPAGGAPLKLTDFLDVATLQDIQDSLAVVAQVKATILDMGGTPLTQTTVSDRFSTRSAAIAAARRQKGDSDLDQPFAAPIVVNGQQLATIVMEPARSVAIKTAQVNRLAKKIGIPAEQIRKTIDAMNEEGIGQRSASVQFLYLLANALSRLCQQELSLRHRIEELQALFTISQMLTGTRGLQQILDRITRGVAQAMRVKSCSLRLLDEQRDELVIKSVYGLSDEYLHKGQVLVRNSKIDRLVLSGQTVYIANMAADPRVTYPAEAAREGIVSSLCTRMEYKGRAIGVLRLYTAEPHEFSDVSVKMLQSIAAQAAMAIETARLQEETLEKDRLERQVQIAAEVQRRMMPSKAPKIPGFDIAALYVPCFELGGDFFDFIPLGQTSLGVTVADVVGKGLPASLLMATVRAAMRAHVQSIYDLDEVMRRVNRSMCADMKSNEFITLWYGTLNFQSKQLTYCNAGHEPPLLVRRRAGAATEIIELSAGGMVLGVDPTQAYSREVVQLEKGDLLWIYTDGVPDAMNYNDEKFGKGRMREALLKYADESAEQICRQMLWETRRFVGLNRRTDDTTIVVLKYTG